MTVGKVSGLARREGEAKPAKCGSVADESILGHPHWQDSTTLPARKQPKKRKVTDYKGVMGRLF